MSVQLLPDRSFSAVPTHVVRATSAKVPMCGAPEGP